MTQELIERLEPIPNPRATPGARRAPIDEALAFLRANRDTHSRWAEYFEQNPTVEADYLATGVWEGAEDQRRVERQYSAAIITFEKAADALQSQSARIAELEDLPRLIELQRTAAPDCDREEGWNAGLDRAADIARASLTKDSTSAT